MNPRAIGLRRFVLCLPLLAIACSGRSQNVYPAPTIMQIAASEDAEKLRLQLEQGRDPNEMVGRKERTLLSWAAERGHGDEARLLLDWGADPNIPNVEGRTPISLAARPQTNLICQPHMVSLLLSRGASIDGRDRLGFTPLVYAALSLGDPAAECVQILLDHGLR